MSIGIRPAQHANTALRNHASYLCVCLSLSSLKPQSCDCHSLNLSDASSSAKLKIRMQTHRTKAARLILSVHLGQKVVCTRTGFRCSTLQSTLHFHHLSRTNPECSRSNPGVVCCHPPLLLRCLSVTTKSHKPPRVAGHKTKPPAFVDPPSLPWNAHQRYIDIFSFQPTLVPDNLLLVSARPILYMI